MRSLAFILAASILTGCAHGRPEKTVLAPQSAETFGYELAPEHEAEAVTASALVFQPPVAGEGLDSLFARDDREPSAFLGYDDGIAEYFHLRTDDRQSDRHFSNYERRAVSERSGVRYH